MTAMYAHGYMRYMQRAPGEQAPTDLLQQHALVGVGHALVVTAAHNVQHPLLRVVVARCDHSNLPCSHQAAY